MGSPGSLTRAASTRYDAYKLPRLPLHMLTSSTTAALDQEDELHRKRLQNTVALAAPEYCVNRGYELYAVTAGEWDAKNAEPRGLQDPDSYSNTGFPLGSNGTWESVWFDTCYFFFFFFKQK